MIAISLGESFSGYFIFLKIYCCLIEIKNISFYFKISDYLAIPGSMCCYLLTTVYSLFNLTTTTIIIIIYHIHFNGTFLIKIFGTLKKKFLGTIMSI